jgi:hypothetical protein
VHSYPMQPVACIGYLRTLTTTIGVYSTSSRRVTIFCPPSSARPAPGVLSRVALGCLCLRVLQAETHLCKRFLHFAAKFELMTLQEFTPPMTV